MNSGDYPHLEIVLKIGKNVTIIIINLGTALVVNQNNCPLENVSDKIVTMSNGKIFRGVTYHKAFVKTTLRWYGRHSIVNTDVNLAINRDIH